MPFLKEEKSEHERARTSMLTVQPCCARHCELPLSKMGNKGLFPGVAVPLAFFCTLFFRHRKKSVSAPWDGQSQSAPESARQAQPGEIAYGRVVSYRCKQGGFPLAPLHPLRIASEVHKSPMRVASFSLVPNSTRLTPPRHGGCACGRTGGFPLAPSPLRFASRSNRAPHRAASPAPAPESVRQAPTKGNFLRQGCLLSCKQGAFRSPPVPFGSPPEAIERPIGLQTLLP